MKIGVIGNMNNNAHNLVQFLRADGADATLMTYENEDGHFMPEADEFDPITYPTQRLAWGSYGKLYDPRTGPQVRKDLAPYDLLIGSRLAPSYVHRFTRRSLDVFMPTGGDIWTVPVFTDFQPKNLVKYLFFSGAQGRGIRAARRVSLDDLTPEVEAVTMPLYDQDRRWKYGVPAIFLPSYHGAAFERRLSLSKERSRFADLRAKTDILLMHHVKHLWQPKSVRTLDIYQAKGNDRVFHALAQLRRDRPDLKVLLMTFEYGADTLASKALAAELGVADMVAWLPKMPRRELMIGLSFADALIGELARSWLTYGCVIEAMALDKPIIHNRSDGHFPGRRLYPMYNAETASEVAAAIARIADNPQEARNIGGEGRRWYEEETVRPLIRSILALKPRMIAFHQ